MKNIDPHTVEGFGDEWQRFQQSTSDELRQRFNGYFARFPWHSLSPGAVGMDVGCGSGRWARFVAPRVGLLHCIDPASAALEVARTNLAGFSNCRFHVASADEIPLPDGSQDFAYCLGVLHHVPDTLAALKACARKLKPGAPFLLYLYYAFDNRPLWFRLLWQASNGVRVVLSRMPFAVRARVAEAIALFVYWPLARSAAVLERLGTDIDGFPLSTYRRSSFYTMRTDALDRFGTRLEKRFRRGQICAMLESAGFDSVDVHGPPYWCAVARKSQSQPA
jgi:SAM-dependent methyltransferase